ncbi:MAG: peptide ABC transporter permease [Spirochaetaceae bacterium 4572_7]|nr:MAG: peptide ABC transporter permease [Spirochaetaceae bacterium 4572_7]
MFKYFIHRLLLVIPTFIGITLVVFTVTRFVPGGPVDQAIRQAQMGNMGGDGAKNNNQKTGALSDEAIAQLNAMYGFDKPFFIAYGEWLWDFVRLDFGKSYRYGDDVKTMIVERIPVSIYFGLSSLVVAYLIAIPMGISKALKHGTAYDNITSGAIFVGYALPSYIVGIILLSIFSFKLGVLPIGGFEDAMYEYFTPMQKVADRFKHLVLPLLSYSLGSLATMTLLMKNNLMENMAADYIKTAIAKGRTFKEAMWLHAFRNSIIPIAANLGAIISLFLAGSFLIENIYNIRGMGQLSFNALISRDFPVVLATLAVSATLSLVGNIISDFILSVVDPRIKLGS